MPFAPNPLVDLTTLENVHVWLSIPDSDTSMDQKIQMLITAESQMIQNWCNRNFIQQSYTETRDGSGSDTMMFNQYPASAVSSVQIGGTIIQPSPTLPGATNNQMGYYFTSRKLMMRYGWFPRGSGNIVFTYTAGWPANALPMDLMQAATEVVAFRMKQSKNVGAAGGKNIDGQSVQFGGTGKDGLGGVTMGPWPDSALTVFNHYRKVIQILPSDQGF